MKRLCSFILASLALSWLPASLSLCAAPVGEAEATAAAKGFLSRSGVAARVLPGRSVAGVEQRASLWIAALEPSGHVVLAGSTKCAPVISFSAEDFAEPPPGSPLDAKLRADSDWCEEKEADASAADDPQWAALAQAAADADAAASSAGSSTSRRRLLSASAPSAESSDPYVPPMLGASWYQDAPYNDLSPLNSLSGCMATAGGQEHRYWRWPYRYEKWRTSTHGLRNSLNEYSDHKFRLNGLVPFDYDKIWGSYSAPTKTTPTAADKAATYNAAFLSLWMQSLTGMGYKPGGSGGTIKLCTLAEDFWFEKGPVMNYWRDGYTNLWTAVTNDLAQGSPIQVNSPGHQMVVDGYAVDDAGTDSEVDWININYGWGSAGGWNNFKTAVTESTPGGRLADFQTGYRPQKIVQFEPVPKISTSTVTLKWHIAPCYTNQTTGFTVEIAKTGGETATETVSTHEETTAWTKTGLDDGGEYVFTVTPVMADGSQARSNSATTTIGTPAAAPEILSVSSVAGGIELVQQGFYIECGRGIVNDIAVSCSESTTSLEAYPSHITVLPDEKVSVTKSGSVFTVHLDATAMSSAWDGDMLVLTLVAKNTDGTEAYKNLMLRFNSMRQVLDGTFELVETNPTTPVWYCGTATLDAKGQNISFGANAFQGNGCSVTLTDSVGGGSFTFANLNGFLGTLHITSAVTVNLPSDMSGFRGTLAYDRCYTDNSFHYTLSRDLPATATVYLPQYTLLYLDNVTVDAAITGAGAVYIVSGNSTLNNTSGFSGTIELGDYTNSGILTLSAGEEPGVSIWNGTLYLTLSKAQVAYGYSTTNIGYNWGTLIFQDENGNELKRWTTDDKTFSIAASANTWTPDTFGTGNFNDAARWSQGIPAAGDYVIFNDNFGDTEMTLNLSSDLNLGYVKVIGTKFNIKSSGTGILSVDTFENETYTKISTANFQPGVVIPEAKLFVADGITIDCEIDQSLAKNMRDLSDTMDALVWEDCWHGTVVFKDYTAVGLNPWEWGNSNSVVRLNGVTGYFAYNKDFYGPVELVDNGSTVALHWNNGSGSSTDIFHKLTGTGTFKTSGSGAGEKVLIKDASEFEGSFQLAAKTVAIGPAMPSTNTGSNGRLHVCTNATLAADAIWNIGGGVYLGADCDLTVRGQLLSTGSVSLNTYADGAAISFEDGSLLRTAVALSGDYSPSISFKAGTWQTTANVTQTKTVNFCAPSGSYTTLDANGKTVTLGPDFFSGSGDVYLTSSASGGKFILQGVGAAFTGTIFADVSAGFTLDGDISQMGGTLSISDITLALASSGLGNVDVGSGASLVVTVSKGDRIRGLEISSVTLASGSTMLLQDSEGTELATFTAEDAVDGKFVLAPDETLEPTCVLDYEFNGNKVSTGTDANTLSGGGNFNSEQTALLMSSQPWINKTFAMPDDEWTASMRCTLPAANSEKPTIAIMYGINGGSLFGIVAGTAENTVALASGTGLIGEAVAVDSATTKYHVYTIVKTAGRVRLYVDGVLKVNEAATVSVTKRFQIGSVHGGNHTSYGSCTDTNALVDYLRFYDFAADADFIESQNVFAVTPSSGSTVEQGATVTMAYDNPTATIWYKLYGEEEYTQYAAPLTLDSPGAKVYLAQVRDAGGNVIVEDQTLAYFVNEAQEPAPADPDTYAVEPTAIWYKDFKTATKGGCTLSTSGTTAVADDTHGSTLTIGDAGAVIDTSSINSTQLTVLMKYTAATSVLNAPLVAFGGTTGGNGLDVGAYTKSDKTLAVYRNFNTDNSKPYSFSTSPTLSATGGYVLCARNNSNGFMVYVGDSLDSMTGASMANAGIKFSNVTLTSLGIGGSSARPANANDMVPFTGLVIEKIAVFNGYYTPDDLIPKLTLSIDAGDTMNFAAGETLVYEKIGTLSSSGTIAVTNDTIAAGTYKLAEWTIPQQYTATCAGYGRVGSLSVPNLPSNLAAELVYGAKAIYLRVYDAAAQSAKPTLSIMPYGDSITEGFNAQHTGANYRILLYQKLRLLGYNVKSCGVYGLDDGYNSVAPSGEPLDDVDRWHSAKHGAVAGRSTTTASTRSDLEENVDTIAAAAGKPDFVLLHIGINDLVSSDRTPATVCRSVTNIAWRLANDLPDTKIVLSTVLNVTGSQKTRTFNNVALPDLVAQFNALLAERIADFPEGRVYLADLNSYVQSDDTGIIYSDGIHPDWWGFDQMAEGWLSVITNVYPSASGAFPSATPLPAVAASDLGAAAKPELAAYRDGFTLAQTITVASTNAPSVVDGSGPTENIGKVAYFVEYVRADNEAHKWVWVDMDAFATTVAELGLPATNHQQAVTKLHVYSNHNAIDNVAADDDSVTGFVEFTPFTYSGGASGVTGAPAGYYSSCDWNDTLGSSGAYGSMQIHRIAPPTGLNGQVLFAYNNWQSSSSAAEFGIGNFSQHFHAGTQTFDYTDTKNLEKMNASAYRVKTIEIWTKAAAEEPAEREVYYKSGYWGTGGDTSLAVTLADGTTETTLQEGDTIVIDSKSSSDIYFGPLPDYANNIRVSRNVVFSSGENVPAMLDGATVTVDSGCSVTVKRQWNDIALGSFSISGGSAVTLDNNGGALTLCGALESSVAVTIPNGKSVGVAATGAVTATLDGAGRIAFAQYPASAPTLASGWTGTVALPEFASSTKFNINAYGNANSTVELAGMSAGWIQANATHIVPALKLTGLMNLASMSVTTYSFSKITGTGGLTFASTSPTGISITEVTDYDGAITNNSNVAVSIATLALPEGASVAPGTKLLATGGTGAVTVDAVTVGGVAQTGLELVAKSDGIYVASVVPVTPENIDTYDTTDLNDEDLVLQVTYTPEGSEATTELISGILKVENGAVVLNPAASYESVPVTPTLDATAAAPIDLSGETAAVFAFKAIAGLWYSVEYSGALGAGGLDTTDTTAGETEPEQATATGAATISAPKAAAGASGLFYRIRAAVKEEDS